MANLQLHFNGNFALKKEEISKIIRAAAEEKGLKDDLPSLMARTSLGNAKVGRIKSWAIRCGLIQDNHLSPVGEIVWRLDPELESPITDWLMHFYLSFGDQGIKQPPAQADEWGGWCYFVYSFLPEHSRFTLEDLQYNCASVFDETSKAIGERIKYILKAYTQSQALSSCKFLTLDKDQYSAGDANLPNPYLVGYFLAQLWERDYPGVGSVLTESIFNQKMGLAQVLGIKTEALLLQLNMLEAYGIIEQRKAVPPFQVIKRFSEPLMLLEKAYDSDR